MSQRIVSDEAWSIRVGGLLQNSAENVEYQYQFYDQNSTCTGTPYGEPFDIREIFLNYASWQGDTPFWLVYTGLFGQGDELLQDMEGWSIAIMVKDDPTHL